MGISLDRDMLQPAKTTALGNFPHTRSLPCSEDPCTNIYMNIQRYPYGYVHNNGRSDINISESMGIGKNSHKRISFFLRLNANKFLKMSPIFSHLPVPYIIIFTQISDKFALSCLIYPYDAKCTHGPIYKH